MITCDQVVSGGSAERTTKMAAAPAADSVYSPPGFQPSSTLFSRFLLSLVNLSFFFSVFLLPLIIRYFLSLSSPLFQFSSGFFVSVLPTLIAFHVLFRGKTPMWENVWPGEVNGAAQDQLMLMSSHISPIIVDH